MKKMMRIMMILLVTGRMATGIAWMIQPTITISEDSVAGNDGFVPTAL